LIALRTIGTARAVSAPPKGNAVWWGGFSVPIGRTARFRIGPLALAVSRLPHEWQVRREHAEGSAEQTASVEVPASADEPPVTGLMRARPERKDDASEVTLTRYATASETTKLEILPVLPDRTVVTRPENPLTILPNTRVTLYVGSPVWARLLQGNDEMLGDVPVSPPKEAWLGPSTREGELCYATHTYGRLSLDEGALAPHRVMTAVTIENRVPQPFVCERVNLPVRRLSVYSSPQGRLWTESVTLEREGELANLVVDSRPPDIASGATRITGPRDLDGGGLFRAFGTLFR
jgi:hypothetical protein